MVEAEFINGAARSSIQALVCHFRQCHQRYHAKNRRLYWAVSLAFTRLKWTASGAEQRDMYIWYALAERLAREGYNPEWMYVHVEPRCPRCLGKLIYDQLDTNRLTARCRVNCTDDNANCMVEIRETIAELYSQAFSQEDDVLLSTTDILVI